MAFVSRLVSLGKQKETHTAKAAATPAPATASSAQDFLAYCSPESVKLIFQQLLSPRPEEEGGESQSQIQGHCSLSLPVMKCLERFYCWLGIHQGYLELAPKPAAASASFLARNYFSILRPLSEHSEWQVFLAIVMTVAEVSALLPPSFPSHVPRIISAKNYHIVIVNVFLIFPPHILPYIYIHINKYIYTHILY